MAHLGFPAAYLCAQRDAQWLIRAEERIRCHQLLLARNALGIFIQAGQPDMVRFTMGKLEAML
ncbi:hypothetical protein STSP_23430 [Streptomyces jeddahensis]|uniref:Uncharacterized protein n=1 Tax=Streptomyces jeddahensis TaxID=1716141 RepID=A0A177HTG9_9ACTN|nr:hypothetical protein STSP_23430 [Streptomyces jeddahensis]